MTTSDYSAWTGPLPRSEYKAFVASAKQKKLNPEADGLGREAGKNGVIVGLAGIAGSILGVWGSLYLAGQSDYHLFGLICAAAIGLFGLWGVGVVVWYLPRFLRRWPNFYRASRFAKDNGLEFHTLGPVPKYDGAIFHIPSEQGDTKYVLKRDDRPVVEVGKLMYRNKYRDTARTGGYRYEFRSWGYIVVELPVSVPSRVVLRSNAPASEGAMGLSFAKTVGAATVLDETYTLYSPAESAEVARQVFTPELLTHIRQLEDKFSPVNAELIGNHLYIFSLKKTFDMYKAADVRLVFDAVAAAVPNSSGSSV